MLYYCVILSHMCGSFKAVEPKLWFQEAERNLFTSPDTATLAHLSTRVAGWGGHCCTIQEAVPCSLVMQHSHKYICNLITKAWHLDKPTYESLRQCLQALHNFWVTLHVEYLAMPIIRCFEWVIMGTGPPSYSQDFWWCRHRYHDLLPGWPYPIISRHQSSASPTTPLPQHKNQDFVKLPSAADDSEQQKQVRTHQGPSTTEYEEDKGTLAILRLCCVSDCHVVADRKMGLQFMKEVVLPQEQQETVAKGW